MVAVGKRCYARSYPLVHSRTQEVHDHGQMAAEFPSDDVEAFVHSGARVFDKYKVDAMRKTCKKPKYVGEVCADADEGKNALQNLRFVKDKQGLLHIWELPETDEKEVVTNRYLTIVDVGGRFQ